MTINKNKLTENTGFNFETMEDLVYYISNSIEWLTTHNKNYTKEHYNIEMRKRKRHGFNLPG